MNTAIISITENGRILSRKIADAIGGARYAFRKHTDSGAEGFSDLQKLVSDIFRDRDALIFICACGIAVRAIAPHIVSKTSDPAVVVIDDLGSFAVPILSGHIGGANALAKKIAQITGAVPVITTATDIGGKFSPDSFAVANNLHICDMAAAKEIAAAVLGGEQIGLICDYPAINIPEQYFGKSTRAGIYIGREDKKPFEVTLRLVPKNISVGIGCKRGTDPERLSEFIRDTMAQNNLPLYGIGGVHTIDLKKDEPAVIEFCRKNKIPLTLHSAKALNSVAGEFDGSEFVKSITGVDNVCERAAAFDGGKIIVKKTARNAVAMALGERAVKIDFNK